MFLFRFCQLFSVYCCVTLPVKRWSTWLRRLFSVVFRQETCLSQLPYRGIQLQTQGKLINGIGMMREFQAEKKINQMLSCNILNQTNVLMYAGLDGI